MELLGLKKLSILVNPNNQEGFVMSNITKVEKLSNKLAERLNLGVDGRELIDTLKETAFRGQVSDSQMAALLIVADQYGLNPWTKEIYAFPDRQNGIVPVVGVDGWSRIINGNGFFPTRRQGFIKEGRV